MFPGKITVTPVVLSGSGGQAGKSDALGSFVCFFSSWQEVQCPWSKIVQNQRPQVEERY